MSARSASPAALPMRSLTATRTFGAEPVVASVLPADGVTEDAMALLRCALSPPEPTHGTEAPAPEDSRPVEPRVVPIRPLAGTVRLTPMQIVALRAAERESPRPADSTVRVRIALPRRRRRILAALGLLVACIGGWVALQVTIATNHRWVAPTMLSTSDPRVVQVAAMLQEQTARRTELLRQRDELAERVRQGQRWAELEKSFQDSFLATLHADLVGQRAELRRLQKLATEVDGYPESAPVVRTLPNIRAQLAAVRQRVWLLQAALTDKGLGSRYTALSLRREYDRSLIASEEARQSAASLTQALADLDDNLRGQDAVLASIAASPYARAIEKDATLGFVPYDNAGQVRTGDGLVACRVGAFFCHRAGVVGEALPGEVRGTGVAHGEELRGHLVRLSLSEPGAVERQALYAEARR